MRAEIAAVSLAEEAGDTRHIGRDLGGREGSHLLQCDADGLAEAEIKRRSGRDGHPIERKTRVVGGARAGTCEDPALALALTYGAADHTADPGLGQLLTFAPDIGHGLGGQQAEVVEDRSGQEEIYPALGAYCRDHAEPSRGHEAALGIGET